MEALDSKDVQTIQALRIHRNELAHNLPNLLDKLDVYDYSPLLEKTDKVLFKLSNYRVRMEIGADPKFQNQGINWNDIKGPEYMLFEQIIDKLNILLGIKK